MNWFEGDISAAIALAKQRNDVFVVFVHGTDEASSTTMKSLNSPEVSRRLNTDGFVAIKLESGSQSYHHFVQIYQLVPVPSLFFIGENGEPVDVVPGKASSTLLLEHISKVQAGRTSKPTDDVQPGTSINVECANTVVLQSDVNNAPNVQNTLDTNIDSERNSTTNSAETVADRIRRAEKTRAALAAKKQKEEEEREREREIIRRREGRELAEVKRAKEALETQQALEERRRERIMEREAREKVLQQILQDKLERAARTASERGTSPPSDTSAHSDPVPTAVSTGNTARLQFRTPNGSSHTHTFDAEAKLGEVRQYVRSTIYHGSFVLSISFPRSELSTSDDNRSLRDLGLVPSAALLIVPAASVSSVVASPGSSVMALVWFILTPFSMVWSFISSRVWNTPDNPPPDPPTERGTSATAAAAQHRANQSEVRHRVKREGNVHRLAGVQDPDDENNTYNGNSTQQM